MHYNPLVYIRSEKDILELVNTIILNTKGGDCTKTKAGLSNCTKNKKKMNRKTFEKAENYKKKLCRMHK